MGSPRDFQHRLGRGKPAHVEPADPILGYKGEVVYIYAFDFAYEMKREPIRELLGHPVAQFSMDASKRNPRHMVFYRPQMVRLPAIERIGPRGPLQIERLVKILPVGAFSITMRVPFQVRAIKDLAEFHDLQFTNGSIHEEVRALANDLRRELEQHSIRPLPDLVEEEAYTVFGIQGPLRTTDGAVVSAEKWLTRHRREVASALTQEQDPRELSDQETRESTMRYLSYYQSDLVVVDWDAALVIDEPKDLHEIVYIFEMANLQLAELEAYDRILDNALERSYRDLSSKSMKERQARIAELREIRIDMARFSDEMGNITKFFGDWHLARIYQDISARFHLADWHKSVDEKLKTLDDLYQLLSQDQNNRWMLLLELSIVLLFIVDLIMLFMGLSD